MYSISKPSTKYGSGIFPVNFRTRCLFWHVHVHFDCAGWDETLAAGEASGIFLVNLRAKWCKMALVKYPYAFRLRRLAQNGCRGLGVRHFSCWFPDKMALVKWLEHRSFFEQRSFFEIPYKELLWRSPIGILPLHREPSTGILDSSFYREPLLPRSWQRELAESDLVSFFCSPNSVATLTGSCN